MQHNDTLVSQRSGAQVARGGKLSLRVIVLDHQRFFSPQSDDSWFLPTSVFVECRRKKVIAGLYKHLLI